MTRPNTTTGQIRAFFQRVVNLETEIKGLNSDKSLVYAEAKAMGYDVKALKAAIARARRMQDHPNETAEADAMVDLYLGAILGGEDAETPPAATVAPAKGHSEKPSRARARARETEHDPETGEIIEQDHADGLPGPEESREDAAPHPLASEASEPSPQTLTAETAAPIQESEGGGAPGTRVAEAAPDEASAPISEPAAPLPPRAHGGTGEAGDTRSPASPTITEEEPELPAFLDRRSKAA